jgi:hypothetical protein
MLFTFKQLLTVYEKLREQCNEITMANLLDVTITTIAIVYETFPNQKKLFYKELVCAIIRQLIIEDMSEQDASVQASAHLLLEDSVPRLLPSRKCCICC